MAYSQSPKSTDSDWGDANSSYTSGENSPRHHGTTSDLSDMDLEFLDFTTPDDLSSLTLVIEGEKLYVHREVLAAWSPVFRSMFTRDFKEKDQREIELPGKKVDDFVELLHCMYPPIKPITDSNFGQLLPLAEEYQIVQVKRKCEEYLLTKAGSIELLVTAQTYGLQQLRLKCIEYARTKSFTELQKDPFYQLLEAENLIGILQLRVQDLESSDQQAKKQQGERDARLFGVINELASGYGNFCTECKSRKVNDDCKNCLKMFRQKVRTKCDEAKNLRNQSQLL
ncbi:hypothetical protein CAPTEDRAFT_192565 [Capitella teleta]|uniref:BTB domain-containing protein n=1 Tax=Capitella teleta TaxID=283909 RepID=R7U4L5_CAPTE|nr:hypothetical protein CAPTEDRAFT_192565 [Capitella teleta]|eukprot:ELU00894.1 hypothetical protein CAPTEDRAFT_192565 [Capitella teleta]